LFTTTVIAIYLIAATYQKKWTTKTIGLHKPLIKIFYFSF
jgi:hypothetical protein